VKKKSCCIAFPAWGRTESDRGGKGRGESGSCEARLALVHGGVIRDGVDSRRSIVLGKRWKPQITGKKGDRHLLGAVRRKRAGEVYWSGAHPAGKKER